MSRSVAEVLRGAADIVESRGLLKSAVGVRGGPRCTAGAIMEAAGFEITHEGIVPDEAQPAIEVVALAVAGTRDGGAVCEWNNAPERTAADVASTLREIAGSFTVPPHATEVAF